jgi:hypothetical protein
MTKTTRRFSRSNLELLVAKFGSQTALATAIAPDGVTQPMISQCLGNSRTKRWLRDYEARHIEQKLEIPTGWLHKYDLKSAWPAIEEFRAIHPDKRKHVEAIVAFIERWHEELAPASG